jgi:hypothetical protein
MSSEREQVGTLEQEVDRIRGNIGALVRELNHRRHDALDLKLQFRQHTARMVLVGVTFVAFVAGGIAYAMARLRRRRTIRAKVNRLRTALRRISAHPERVAERTPNVSRKMLAAGGGAIAAAVGKRIAKRFVSA